MNRTSRHRERDIPAYTDDYDRLAKRPKTDRISSSGSDHQRSGGTSTAEQQQYRTLCVSHLNARLVDADVSEMIYRDLKKFGEFNVKIVRNGANRIAYINFRYPEDARLAKHACCSKLVLIDVGKRIEAVYNAKPPVGASPPLPSAGVMRDEYFYRSGSPLPPPYPDRLPKDYVGRMREPGGGGGGYYRDVLPLPALPPPKGGPSKNDKYQQHHNNPPAEDDEIATRTLFVGNLAFDITTEELKDVFGPFGFVEDVDVKRNAQGHGNIYAFVRFATLDMARRAKAEMSGQYIRKYQCRIGYGKPTPSVCIWVGGLGPWMTKDGLLREFDRFGEVRTIDWPHGKNDAYLLYASLECAMAAVQNMRGRDFGGPDRRLRVDFADENFLLPSSENLSRTGGTGGGGGRNGKTGTSARDYDPPAGGGDDRDRGARNSGGRLEEAARTSRGSGATQRSLERVDSDRRNDYERSSGGAGGGGGTEKHRTAEMNSIGGERNYRTQSSNADDARSRRRPSSADRRQSDRDTPDGRRRDATAVSADDATTIGGLARCLTVAWSGALMLKNGRFMTRMHLLGGDGHLVRALIGTGGEDSSSTGVKPDLKITQRLRLDQQKLSEVRRRISLAGPDGCSILLAMPFGGAGGAPDGQQRPLKNLVSYLKQKDAAGIISLPPNAGQNRETGLLHVFPSCPFAHQYMAKYAPKLAPDYAKEDHLLILVVRVHA